MHGADGREAISQLAGHREWIRAGGQPDLPPKEAEDPGWLERVEWG